MGLSMAGRSGVGLGLGALRWLAWVDPVTDASGFLYHRLFDRGLSGGNGAVQCGRRHLPLWVGGRHALVQCVCACARPSWPGRAGRPPRCILVRLSLFVWPLCLSALLCPLCAGVAPFLVLCLSSPPLVLFFSPLLFSSRPLCLLFSLVCGPGCPGPWRCVLFVLLAVRALSPSLCVLPGLGCSPVVAAPPAPLPLAVFVSTTRCLAFVVFFSPLVCAPVVSGFLWFPAPGAPSLGAVLCLFFFLRPHGSPCALACFVSPAPPLAAPWWLLPPPPLVCFFVSRFSSLSLGALFFSSSLCAPVVFGFLWFPALGALGLGTVFCLFCGPPAARLSVRFCLPCVPCLAVGCSLVVATPPPLFMSRGFPSLPLGARFFFFLLRCAPPLSLAFSGFRPRVPWASALCNISFVGLPLLGSPCALASFVLPAWLLAAPWWLPPPPPPFASRGFRHCRSVLCAVCCAVLCVPGCGAAPRCCALCRLVLCCCVLCCFVAFVWCRCLLCRALWRCPSPWVPVLCVAVFCGVPPRCVLCAVRVLSWRGGVRCCLPLCFVLSLSWGAVLCDPCPLRSVRCYALLCWCACVVLFVSCVLLLAPGALVRCCVLCCFLWCAVVSCWVWWPVVVCWWRLPVLVSLSGRVVCFPVVRGVCCGALLPCVVLCGAVLSRGAVLLCSAVVLRCCWCLLCPPVARRAVLCCAVGWLCCFLPGGGVRMLWCFFPRAVCSLSSPLCALLCLAVLAVVPCFPVSCAMAPCCPVVLCCRALLSCCGAGCACFALLWPVVRGPAVLCCAVGCLCRFLPSGGVCVLWCPFPPCRHAQKTSIITLCYPASVSASVVDVVEECGLFVRRCFLVFRSLS